MQARDKLRDMNAQSITGSEGVGIDCSKGPITDIPNLFSKSRAAESPIDMTKRSSTSGIITKKGYLFSNFWLMNLAKGNVVSLGWPSRSY